MYIASRTLALLALVCPVCTSTPGCVAPDDEPRAEVVSTKSSAIGNPAALSALKGLYGLTSEACSSGEHVAFVVAYRQSGAATDLATALGNGFTVNRFNQTGGTSPQAPVEPGSTGGAWKRLTRTLTQGFAAMADSGCILDIYEATSDSEANMGAAADTARQASPTPRTVVVGWGFDESAVAAGFKAKFAPQSNQAIVAVAGKTGGGAWFAPAVYGTTISVGQHAVDANDQPIGLSGGLSGYSATESKPTFQPSGFTARRMPDLSGFGGLVSIVEDGNTVSVGGLAMADAIVAALAALAADPQNAHLWAAAQGLIDIVNGTGAATGPADDYGLGIASGILAF